MEDGWSTKRRGIHVPIDPVSALSERRAFADTVAVRLPLVLYRQI